MSFVLFCEHKRSWGSIVRQHCLFHHERNPPQTIHRHLLLLQMHREPTGQLPHWSAFSHCLIVKVEIFQKPVFITFSAAWLPTCTSTIFMPMGNRQVVWTVGAMLCTSLPFRSYMRNVRGVSASIVSNPAWQSSR